ncbi:PIN domain-containing protein [Haloactinospora alba]|uniref:hypothetical protein n=1 Tax=Haloactinospora alba TaxID=405555 RepID=UPI001FE4273E|nr:hypothetical protein [Haloactinospora alba]
MGYLLAVKAGTEAESGFLASLAMEDFTLASLTPADTQRMAQLVTRYADLPLGTTDASVIALAERLGTYEVATLDRRHFTVVRPSHVESLHLLP